MLVFAVWGRHLSSQLPEPSSTQEKNEELVAKLGGIKGLLDLVRIDPKDGVDLEGPLGVEARRARFGTNALKQTPPKKFLSLWLKALKVCGEVVYNDRGF